MPGRSSSIPNFAADGDDVCSAPRAVRTARRPRLLQAERALRVLRHHCAGRAAGSARAGDAGRLRRVVSVRSAGAVRNLDSAAHPRGFVRAVGAIKAPAACAISPACFAARCSAFAPSPRHSTWCCTLRRTRYTRRAVLGYWKTIDEDYHWHIEILPILGAKAKSYTFKEVYYSPVTSETAVKRLRDAKIDS